jgi:hypothetical protein
MDPSRRPPSSSETSRPDPETIKPDPSAAEASASDSSTDPELEDLLEGYQAPEGFRENDRGDDQAEGGQAQKVYLSPEQFFELFRVTIGAPNWLVKPPLKSLEIPADDQAAREASKAIYEICWDVPWLRWILEPGTEWGKRALVIAAFLGGLAMNLRAELEARRREAAKHARQAQEKAAEKAEADRKAGADGRHGEGRADRGLDPEIQTEHKAA